MTPSQDASSSTVSPSTVWTRATGIVLLALAVPYAFLVVGAPVDRIQGPIQKILYVHVPAAFATYLGFALTAFGSAMYLWKNDERWDRFAESAAAVGVLMATLMLITGPIWAKGTWGKWWSWDLRLTITLLLYLIYVSYLLLRSFTEGSERTARFSAVYAIAGLAVIPLNYFAIDLSGGRAIHPENLERGSLGDGMGWPFLVGVLTAFAAVFHLLAVRVEVATLRARRAGELAEEGPAPGGEVSWDT